ncbi:MAG: 50S ribosomal protein L32 [Candidatus Pacebacteria bacterium]|nr:50S ribosomal protein L32 [Candidatus Paceibacterota bacterium]MBP9058303.1 50S ribosomal protein L32 [Candidatus Paceibacterota bacterium]MBP9770148.1 50S ribosomal protein L32 [Candidatus Paceibacterota bacterium]
MVVRMRHTRAHTANRRSHHALIDKKLNVCKNCGNKVLPHVACAKCGTYKGRNVVDTVKKVEKKQAKKKARSK